MENKKCPFCGEEILIGASMCKYCRERLEPDAPDVMCPEETTCPFCTENIRADSEVCPHCGEHLSDCDLRPKREMGIEVFMCVVYAASLLAPLFFNDEGEVLAIELLLMALLFVRMMTCLRKQLDDRKLGNCLVSYACLSLAFLPLGIVADRMKSTGFEESVVGYLVIPILLISFVALVFAAQSGVKLVVQENTHLRSVGLGLFCYAGAIISAFVIALLTVGNEELADLGSVLGALKIFINLYIAYHLYQFFMLKEH